MRREELSDIRRFTYDPRYNIAYLHFKEKLAEVKAFRVSDEFVVDVAPDGTVYGIELLNANEQLRREDTSELLTSSEHDLERKQI